MMVVPEQEQLMTVEAFWEQYADQPCELVEGKVVLVTPAGGEAPEIALIFGAEILRFVRKNKLGKVTGAEGGYWLSPITLRAPDIGFYSWEKHKLHVELDKYRPFPPDLAVEVVSPTDKADEIRKKIKLYLQAGVKLVWVVYPSTREIEVHYPDGRSKTLNDDAVIEGEDILPGFTLAVADIFPAEDSN